MARIGAIRQRPKLKPASRPGPRSERPRGPSRRRAGTGYVGRSPILHAARQLRFRRVTRPSRAIALSRSGRARRGASKRPPVSSMKGRPMSSAAQGALVVGCRFADGVPAGEEAPVIHSVARGGPECRAVPRGSIKLATVLLSFEEEGRHRSEVARACTSRPDGERKSGVSWSVMWWLPARRRWCRIGRRGNGISPSHSP